MSMHICAEISSLITVRLDRGRILLDMLGSQTDMLSHEQVDGF